MFRIDVIDERGRCVESSLPASRERCLEEADLYLWLYWRDGLASGWELVEESTGRCEMAYAAPRAAEAVAHA